MDDWLFWTLWWLKVFAIFVLPTAAAMMVFAKAFPFQEKKK